MIDEKDLQQIKEQIGNGILAKRLEQDPAWLMVKEMAKKIAESSLQILSRLGLEVATKGELTQETRILIAKHQARVEVYGGFAQNIIESLYAEGKNAYDLAQELNINIG